MRTEGLTKTFIADGAVTAHTIVKAGSADGYCAAATAATDFALGVADSMGASGAGEVCEVVMSGIATVKAGGNITRGALVICNGSGQVVTVTASAGSNVRIIGIALYSASSGDLIPVLLTPGSYQG